MWYVGMLLLSVLLGCTMSSIYSEPLNRRLRSRGWSGHRDVRSPPRRRMDLIGKKTWLPIVPITVLVFAHPGRTLVE